jgi:hypothetical protein
MSGTSVRDDAAKVRMPTPREIKFALERLFRGPLQIFNYTQWRRELRRGDAL